MKNTKTFLVVLSGVAFCIFAGWCRERANPASQRPVEARTPAQDTNYIQNIFEIQEKLKEQGFYKGKIDGKWGQLTDKAYCDWCATQEFKRYE